MLILSLALLALPAAAQSPDSDGDGIPDNQDECPDRAGQSNFGCPLGTPELSGPATEEPAPPPQQCPDPDGDGIPGDETCGTDRCPFISGVGSRYGGVDGQDGCPVDSDQDGTNDGNDQCPFQAGPAANNGCPTGDTNQQDPGQGQQQEPEPQMPALPDGNICYVAPAGEYDVNKRAEPTTDAQIVDGLLFTNYYAPVAQTIVDGTVWFQFDDGAFASGAVLRSNAACANLPTLPQDDGTSQTEAPQDEAPQADGTTLAPGNLDLSDSLSNCSALTSDAQALPITAQFNIQLANEPCAYAEGLLSQVVFGTDQSPLSDANEDAIMEECPQFMPAILNFMDTMQQVNPDAWQILDSVMTPDNACEFAQQLANRELPQPFEDAVTNGASSGIMLVSAPASVPAARPLAAPVSQATWQVWVSACVPSLSPSEVSDLAQVLVNANIDTDILSNSSSTICQAVLAWSLYGNMDQAGRRFYDEVREACPNYTRGEARAAAFIATRNGVNVADLLRNENLSNYCNASDLVSLLNSPTYQVSPANDPNVPANLTSCATDVRQLPTYNAELGVVEAYWLISAGSCSAVQQWLNTRIVPPSATSPIPTCIDPILPEELIISGSVVLEETTPWQIKVQVLSRANVCAPFGSTGTNIDTDGDGVTDANDSCPSTFGLQPDGCPQPNQAPVVAPLSTQTIVAGNTVGPLAVSAADPEGDPLSIASITANDTSIVTATSTSGLQFELTGVAQGTTTVDVAVTDGTSPNAPTLMSFQVDVVPAPASNQPPTIAALPNQSLTVGDQIDLTVNVSDPDGDPLNLSFSNGAPPVLGLTYAPASRTLTLTALQAGNSTVTAFVNDGQATASTAFQVTVNAPPQQGSAQQGSTGQQVPPSGNVQNANNAGQAFDTSRQDDDQLLDLPNEAASRRGVFAARTGPNAPISIYQLRDGEFGVLLEGDDSTSYHNPSLHPNGVLLAYIQEDTSSGLKQLRILNIPRGLSFTLASDEDDPAFDLAFSDPAWSPTGDTLLYTVANATNTTLLSLDVSNPSNIPGFEVVAEGGMDGSFAPNGNLITYAVSGAVDGDGQDIYVMPLGQPNQARQITQASTCRTPRFGADSLSLYFVCEDNGSDMLYHYNVDGLNAVALAGLPAVQNPAPGPTADFFAIDDGETIYYGFLDDGRATPALRIEGQQTFDLGWLPVLESPEQSPNGGDA